MNVKLYKNNSERNRLNKYLTNETTFDCILLESTSIITPSIKLKAVSPYIFNYAYITEFQRYYFINNITSLVNGLWKIDLYIDVLSTYANEIKNCECIVRDTENVKTNNYINDSRWITSVRDKTEVINFPSGLSNNGEFILITAGG